MFLTNKSKLLRESEDGKYDYILYVSDKKECDSADNNTIESPYDIIAHGDTKDVSDNILKGLLPKSKFIHNLLSSSLKDSYKCFACEGLGIDQNIAHLSLKDSWDCLMNVMGNPEYVIIIQKPKDNAETETI